MKNQPRKKSAKKTKSADQKETILGLHNLKIPHGAHKRKKMKGRGSSSGHGKTSTRGSKGQTSRSGRHFYLGFEGGQMPLIRRMPKRGFTNIFKKEFQLINIENLSKIKESPVTPEMLHAKGLIKDTKKMIKVLGDGDLKHALTVQAHAFSKKASEKILAAGGKAEIINA
ncbi:MAG: 50S ribosomal protein L15 [Candidatus Omnitrophica bacterium]|nr:50S ribosomal protein L15 [Candidatus Omnitrophota bacterium]